MKTFTRRVTQALVAAITFTSMAAGCTQMREPDASSLPSASVGQGGGGTGSGGGVAQVAGALYGDLYVIERDGNGEPALKEKTINGVKYSCQQPLASSCRLLELNFDNETLFNPEVEDACAVRGTDVTLLQAVSFGRESVSRAPATVIDKAYGEALKSINLAVPNQCTKIDGITKDGRAIKRDPSGRITLCLASETLPVTYAWKTIDAPLENLGLYRAAMTSGCFGPVTDTTRGEEGTIITVTTQLSDAAKGYLSSPETGLGHLTCEGTTPSVTREDMLSAAVFLAAGADKTSPVTLDEVINLNNYVGVNTWTYTTSKKVKTLTVKYFQFNGFTYTKGVDACKPGTPDNTATLLTTGNGKSFELKDVDVFGSKVDGVYLRPEPPTNLSPGVEVTVCRSGSPLNVVCDNASASGCGGANWFTQAAEDARKTIWYLHNYEPPAFAY